MSLFGCVLEKPLQENCGGLLLCNVQEACRDSDYWRQDCPSNKLNVKGVLFERFFSVSNVKDARVVKKTLKELSLRYFRTELPVTYRRFVQDERVFYDLYWDVSVLEFVSASTQWQCFLQEARRLLGIFK